jgi:hypothetical protein
MLPGQRSLNLSNAVAVMVFEAWRQLDFAGGNCGGVAPTNPPSRGMIPLHPRF